LDFSDAAENLSLPVPGPLYHNRPFDRIDRELLFFIQFIIVPSKYLLIHDELLGYPFYSKIVIRKLRGCRQLEVLPGYDRFACLTKMGSKKLFKIWKLSFPEYYSLFFIVI
jgi:hypothetical protein